MKCIMLHREICKGASDNYYYITKKTASTLIRLLILELNLLQCDDFNRGHPRLFNQSEADSLTKNFDFVVLKANQICS